MANILCIGGAIAIMHTRRLILERAGHNVSEARDLRDAATACSFTILILDQCLPEQEKLRVGDVVRTQLPIAKILELHSGVAPELPRADSHLQVAAGTPERLLESVASLSVAEECQQFQVRIA